MTLDEFQANKTLKLEAAKWRATPLGSTIIAVLTHELRNLGYIGSTSGWAEADKHERLGAIQGFNKAIHIIDVMCEEPRPPIKEIQATYASPTPPVETKVQQRKRETK